MELGGEDEGWWASTSTIGRIMLLRSLPENVDSMLATAHTYIASPDAMSQ